MEIKVQKQVCLKAIILGLKTDFFYIFLGVSLFMIFFIIFDITISKLLTVVLLLTSLYFILFIIQKIDFSSFLTDLPNILINK